MFCCSNSVPWHRIQLKTAYDYLWMLVYRILETFLFHWSLTCKGRTGCACCVPLHFWLKCDWIRMPYKYLIDKFLHGKCCVPRQVLSVPRYWPFYQCLLSKKASNLATKGFLLYLGSPNRTKLEPFFRKLEDAGRVFECLVNWKSILNFFRAI